jgi:hypothetical protein
MWHGPTDPFVGSFDVSASQANPSRHAFTTDDRVDQCALRSLLTVRTSS